MNGVIAALIGTRCRWNVTCADSLKLPTFTVLDGHSQQTASDNRIPLKLWAGIWPSSAHLPSQWCRRATVVHAQRHTQMCTGPEEVKEGKPQNVCASHFSNYTLSQSLQKCAGQCHITFSALCCPLRTTVWIMCILFSLIFCIVPLTSTVFSAFIWSRVMSRAM